jgi:hypothetical protein
MVFFLFYRRPFLLKGGLGKRRHLTAFYPFGKFFPPFATLLSCHNEFNDMSHLDDSKFSKAHIFKKVDETEV